MLLRPNYFTQSIISKHSQNPRWIYQLNSTFPAEISIVIFCNCIPLCHFFRLSLCGIQAQMIQHEEFFCVISQTVQSRWRRRSSNKEFMRCSAAVTVSWHHCVMGVTRYGTSNSQLPLVFIGSSVKKARHGKLFAVGKNEVRFKTSRLSGFKNWVPNLQQRDAFSLPLYAQSLKTQ